jgi:hypothetical protein
MDPLGPMSIALETARTQLCACTTYQAFLGVATPAAAKAKTYLAGLPYPEDKAEYTVEDWEGSLRPYGIIYQATIGGFNTRRSALYAQTESGRFYIELEIGVPTVYQPSLSVAAIDLTTDFESGDRWIINHIGQIASEFMGLSGSAGYLDVSSVTVAMGPSREQPNEEQASGYFYRTLLEVTWGANG